MSKNMVYLVSVKPALDKFGFVGPSGDVTERNDRISALYYLRDIKKLEASGLELPSLDKNMVELIEPDIFDDDNDFDPTRNTYQIIFEALREEGRNGRNYGRIGLTVYNRNNKGLFGEYGSQLVQVIAPLDHFNETNLQDALGWVVNVVEKVEEGRGCEAVWYGRGLDLIRGEQIPLLGFNYVYPQNGDTNQKHLKRALHILNHGYSI